MNIQEFKVAALRTECSYDGAEKALRDGRTIRLLHAAMGLCTEAGELQDQLKRHIFYGKPLDFVNIKEEAGDIQWYLALLVDAIATNPEDVLDAVIAKLKARYPHKFTEHLAENRDLQAERTALESKP